MSNKEIWGDDISDENIKAQWAFASEGVKSAKDYQLESSTPVNQR